MEGIPWRFKTLRELEVHGKVFCFFEMKNVGITRRVCQVKCVNFFDFIWRSKTDRHIYTIKSNQTVVLRHCDKPRIRVTYHAL